MVEVFQSRDLLAVKEERHSEVKLFRYFKLKILSFAIADMLGLGRSEASRR